MPSSATYGLCRHVFPLKFHRSVETAILRCCWKPGKSGDASLAGSSQSISLRKMGVTTREISGLQQVGWKHGALIQRLESQRKARRSVTVLRSSEDGDGRSMMKHSNDSGSCVFINCSNYSMGSFNWLLSFSDGLWWDGNSVRSWCRFLVGVMLWVYVGLTFHPVMNLH